MFLVNCLKGSRDKTFEREKFLVLHTQKLGIRADNMCVYEFAQSAMFLLGSDDFRIHSHGKFK